MDRPVKIAIADLDASIDCGFYELLVHPDVKYNESIDGSLLAIHHPVHRDPDIQLPCQIMRTLPSTQCTLNSIPSVETLPLSQIEMDTCIKAMLHLISSIPPRYIKYNKVLSAQIDTAMKQVHHLQVSLTHLQSNISSTHSSVHHKPLPVTLDIQTTFTQYRIMQVLFEVWKSVGRRYAPHVRTFNVSNVVTLHNVDTAEHYLNRLCSWRRMIDTHTWKPLTLDMTQQEQQLYFKSPVAELPFSQRSKLRVLGPPALPSGLYPQAWEYLVKPPSVHIINAISSNIHHTKPSDLTTKSVLREFRQLFMNALLKHELYTDYELNILLDQLLCLHGSMYTHHDGESTQPANRFDKNQFDAVEYPYALIRDSICKEFNMGWTTIKDGFDPLKTDLPSLPNAANKQLSQNDRDMDKTIQQVDGTRWQSRVLH